MKNKNTYVIACSILKDELLAFQQEGKLNLDLHFYSSMLHLTPSILENILVKDVENIDQNILLIYGDCCPHMETFVKRPNVSRTSGINCIEIMLGKEYYEKLRSEGVFFLMPEWIHRWKEIFNVQFHMNEKIAQEFMQDFHTKIIYIDLGYKNITKNVIKEIEEFTGLKVEKLKISTDNLKKSILNALDKFKE